MAIETHVHDGSAWRKAKQIYVHDGSAWRKVKQAWCHDGSAWRKVFSLGFWELLIASDAGLPSGYSFMKPTVFGGEYYIIAAPPYMSGGTRQFGLFKWNGSAWAQVGSYVSIVNWETWGYLFVHNGELWVASNGSGGKFYKLSGGALTLVTTAYWLSVSYIGRAIFSSGTDLYVAVSYAGSGDAVKKWNGSSWSNVGTIYEAQSVCVFGGSLYVVGSDVSGGGIYDYRIKKWSGSAWADQTYGGDPANTYLFPGDSDLYAVDDIAGTIYRSTGGAFSIVSSTTPIDNAVDGRRDRAGGIPIIGINDGYTYRFHSARGTTMAPLVDGGATDTGYYMGLHYDGGTLYRTSHSSPATPTIWRYVGDIP